MLNHNPKLRPLDFQPVYFQGQHMWFLRDPLNLSSEQILVPSELTPLFMYLDGTKNIKEIHRTFCLATGVQVPYQNILDAITRLDAACLLDNERSRKEIESQLSAYRAQAFRPPSLAGRGYPEDAQELSDYLNEFLTIKQSEPTQAWSGRGIISPHIDYHRGGPVYAQVWDRAAEGVSSADLVIILGTDHNGGADDITFTKLPYATPYGVLPIEEDVINKLANGQDSPFSEELHHRDEHSIELSAVWLHHTLKKQGLETIPMIPILIGSFHHYLNNGGHPENNQKFTWFVDSLKSLMSSRKVLVVSSVDFAHVGPNFGDPFPILGSKKSEIKAYDDQLISSAITGDSNGWFKKIADVQDRHRICGFSPTYFLLRTLGPTSGFQVAYDQCPADGENTSIVSISGLLID